MALSVAYHLAEESYRNYCCPLDKNTTEIGIPVEIQKQFLRILAYVDVLEVRGS
jgi:hypothetical protein